MGKWLIENIKFIFESFLDVIYGRSENCIICGSAAQENILLCRNCMKKVKACDSKYFIGKENKKFDVISGAYYTDIVMELILRLKYRQDFDCGRVLAYFMERSLKKFRPEFDLITFVPLSHSSLRKRGYNQAEYLADIIGNYENKKVIKCLKKKNVKDQIGLDYQKRWKNLKESFYVYDSNVIKNKKILLIDDVFTTGATSFYCCEKILECGAESASILTAAKSKV